MIAEKCFTEDKNNISNRDVHVLGLGGSDHDVSACLLRNSHIFCAIEEERITRKKHGFESNLLLGESRKYCLNYADIGLDDVDLIVADSILAPTAIYGVRKRAVTLNHHLAHAASAFFPSPFEEAAILVIDNAGELVNYGGGEGVETATLLFGRGGRIEVLHKVIGKKYKVSDIQFNGKPYQIGDPDNSLGYFYKVISHYCGFDVYHRGDFYYTEDGKTMGLAPYGSDYYYERLRPFFTMMPGEIEIDLHSGQLINFLESESESHLGTDAEFQFKANLAYAGQKLLEEAIVHLADYLYEITGCPNLCIAGGVGLNSVANGKILKETMFERLFIQPASGDNGTSIGCALWGHYVLGGNERTLLDGLTMSHAYLGRDYTEWEIEEAISQWGSQLTVSRVEYPACVAAKKISKGEIIGWFQGKSEFGPRALGNRSILANPTVPDMKDKINSRVKFREGFRPFAPAVLYEEQNKYFELAQESPFMLIVCDVRKEYRDSLPAITHVDGTARLQSVTKENNPLFYELIHNVSNITGFPVVLNTSFNVKGEPIVESPNDAIRCFINTNLDCLIIGHFVLTKKSRGV